MGLSLAADFRERAKPQPFAAPGLVADLLLGAKLGDSYATGIGVRGGWYAPLDFDLDLARGQTERAKHNQLVQGTVYWFHQLDGWRFALGPHLSWMVSDSDHIHRDPLFGAELSVAARLARSPVTAGWRNNVWIGSMASHTIAASNDDQDGARETILKLALSFELDSASDPSKPAE